MKPETGTGANLRHHPVSGTGQQIAQVLSGYTLGGADMLRRGWVRKSRKRWLSSVLYLLKVRKERNQRRTGDENLRPGGEIAGYGFNKSHSAAYALVSYQSYG